MKHDQQATGRGRHRLRKSVLMTASAIGLGLSMPAAPVLAQGMTLEEIVVTARRREESLQDVPISMTVLNQQQLDARNMYTSADIAIYTPSLSSNNRWGADQPSFAIRGFTQELRTTASVGFYFAEVVAPRGGGSITAGDGGGPGSMFDLENVQVLKGPQGTLFGRNTTGGAIMLTPRKPTDEFEGYVEGSVGNYDMRRLQGVVNIPVNDRVRMRFGIDTQERDGFLKNKSGVGPSRLSDVDYIAARASLVVDITDNLENYTIFSYLDSENTGSVNAYFVCNPAQGGFNGFCRDQVARVNYDFYTTESLMPDPMNKIEQWQLINTTTWEVNDRFTIKNILSFSNLEHTMRTAVYGTNWQIPSALPIVGGINFGFTNSAQVPGVPTNAQDGFVEELQFQGLAFDDRLTWQAGLYYETSKPDGFSGSQSGNIIHCPERPGLDPANFQCQDLLRAVTQITSGFQNPGNPTGNVQRQLGKVEYDNRAIYGQATYEFNPQWRVTGGVRYTRDVTEGLSQMTAYTNFPTLQPGPPGTIRCVDTTASLPDCSVNHKQKSEEPTWMVGVDYLPNENTMLYGKYSRGYRQGSVNIYGAQGFRTHGPEKVDAYEIGAKTTFNGPVAGNLNVALFYNDLDDQQIQGGFVSTTGQASSTTGIVNAGKSTIWGGEVESRFLLTDNLSLDIGYTYLDTELKSIDQVQPIPGTPFDVIVVTALEGGPLPFSPKHQLVASVNYRMPIPAELGDLTAGASYVYNDKQLITAASPFGTISSYELVNFHLNWQGIMSSGFDASLFVTNAFDEKYTAFIPGNFNSLGGEYRVVGVPRMFGARLRYNF